MKRKLIENDQATPSPAPKASRGRRGVSALSGSDKGGGPRLEWWEIEKLRGRGNPLNWRRHPESQRQALLATMAQVGWAGAFVFNERTGRIIDGHLRESIVEDGQQVPVFIVNLPEDKERLALATHDTLGLHAEGDAAAFAALKAEVQADYEAMAEELTAMMAVVEEDLRREAGEIAPGAPQYWVEVEAGSEMEQRVLYEKLVGDGYEVRLTQL